MENNISKKKLKDFGFLISFGLPILIGWFLPLLGGHNFRIWTLWVSIPALICAISRPGLLFYPYKYWMILGSILSWVNSRIILGAVFLLILQPISIIMKLFNYDPLKKSFHNKKTYREVIKNKKIDLTKIF